MEENEQSDSQWTQALRKLGTWLADQSDFLDAYQNKGLRQLNLYRFPIDAYNKVWKTLRERTLTLVTYQERSPPRPAVLSTLLFWVLPQCAAAYNDIYQFLRRFRGSPEAELVSAADLRQATEVLQVEERFQLKDPSLDAFLSVPTLLLQQLQGRIDQLATCLETQLLTSSSERDQLELRELRRAAGQLQAALELLSREDTDKETVNRENSVIRYNVIRKEYEQVGRKAWLMRWGYRIKLISRWKGLQRKVAERARDRRFGILQLIDGQQKYIKGLQQYIQFVKQPLEGMNLGEQQIRLLFSSISEIRSFHCDMLGHLRKDFEDYNDQQQYGRTLKKYIPFFKLYTDYILNAESAQRLLQDLAKNNKEVAEVCRKYTETTAKIAHNELLQPTFRIARYEMLFQEIIKKTPLRHPDHTQLTEAQATFKKILTQVNDEVDKILRRNRLNQLEQEFGSPEAPLFQAGREYLGEHSLTLIKEPKPEQVILFVFSDLLVVVEEQTRKVLRRVAVDDSFFPRREEDNKIYRNMVTIHSEGFTTFTAGPEDVNANRAEEVYQQLRRITRDSGQQVYVTVLGTEEIGSTSFAKYTEYIVEVKYLELKKLLHLRFSSMAGLVAEMQTHYQNALKITEEDSLRKNWFNSHKSKTIEARKLIIAQILQKLFNHPLIKQQPAHFLAFLSLPPNFYHLARTSYEKRLSLGQSATISGLKRSYLTKKEEREAFTILCGTEIKLGRDLFHDSDNDEEAKKLKENAEKVEIQVLTLIEEQPVLVRITDYDTVEDVCNKVSKLIGLRSNRDFRLFHEIGKKELRVLEHEQLITRIFQFPRPQNGLPLLSFYEQLRSSLTKIVSPDTYPTLLFKKYYYLPFDIEQAEVRKDLTRLRLMVFQVFSEIRDMKYQLTFDEYLLFLAMLVYIRAEGKIEDTAREEPEVVHRVIPETVFKLKNYSEAEWLERCQHHLQRLDQEIKKVIAYNTEQLSQGRIRADTASKTALYFGHRHLCSQIVLNKIKTNPIFGSNIFYVQPHSATYRKLEETGLKVAYNMWLAIKVESLNLLTPSSKESVLELQYKDISKIEVYSESVVLKMQGAIEEEFRLNTYQSFEISQLVKYNQALNEILLNLREDSQLNSRVKLYRDQLIQYRTTYEDDNTFFSMIR